MDSEQCTVLMRLSCTKLVNSRHRKGGVNIHKNLLILHVIKKVQDTKNKLESDRAELMFTDDDDENACPPLEFTVTDRDEDASSDDMSDEVVFASEATEDSTPVYCDRKRKGEERPAPQRKAQRVSDRQVPVLRSLPCK